MLTRISHFIQSCARGIRIVSASPGAAISLVVLVGFIVVAVFAPLISPYDPYETYIGESLGNPSSKNICGLDFLGRDILSRVLFGTQLSLLVGVLATLFSLTMGTILGIFSGFYGGNVEFIISRIIDLWLGFPPIIFALVIVTILGKGIMNVILAVGIASIPRLARVVRGSVLSVKESVYIESAQALGNTRFRIMLRHILPNVVAPIFVLGTLQVGTAIINAASLNFLGLGAAPPTAEWGLMLSEARTYMRYAPWTMIYPGIALFLLTMSMNLLGDRMREIFDPKMERRRH